MSGVFAVDRGIFDHPIFRPEPFTEREAWMWMIGAAAWKPERQRVGRHYIDVQRGQLAISIRYLATKWRWSDPRVRRFLDRVKIDAMVSFSATREATLITICNYDEYQFGRRTDDIETDAPTVEKPTQSIRREEKKEERKESISSLRSERSDDFSRETSDDWPSDYLDLFWQQYPRKVGKITTFKKLKALRKSGKVTWAQLFGGVLKIPIGEARFIPHPTTWLNRGGWDDEVTRPSNGAKNGTASPSDRAYQFAERARELELAAGIGRSSDAVGGDEIGGGFARVVPHGSG